MTAPRRVEYSAPERWVVWVDEDGVHLRTRSGDGLEAPDLDRLLVLVAEVKAQVEANTIPAPHPPVLPF